MTGTNHILIGNSFPLSLVRSRVVIDPRPARELKALVARRGVQSFWGHENTLELASSMIGVDLKPCPERPALAMTNTKRPSLDGMEFRECWILSPDFAPGFRPGIGEEAHPEKIKGWQVLRIKWI